MKHDVLQTVADIFGAVGDAARLRTLQRHLEETGQITEDLRQDLELAWRIHENGATLTRRRELVDGVHDQLAAGVMVVDREGTILSASTAARRLLRPENGLTAVDGRLQAAAPDAAVALADALNRTASGSRVPGSGCVIPIPRSARRPLIVLVAGPTPSAPRILDRRTHVSLVLLDPNAVPGTNETLLEDLYSLTPREAELALLLMDGLTLEEAARKLRVTTNTVRTHLKRVTAKTDSHSQADLVRRLHAVSSFQP
jgi:DNA-binding CsgD family transcriptional regulator